MYLDYLNERENIEVLTKDYGFLTYKINKDEIFIQDCYVKPEFRKTEKPKELLSFMVELAKVNNKNYVTCQVDIMENNPERSVVNILKNKFKILSLDGNLINFVYEVNNG